MADPASAAVVFVPVPWLLPFDPVGADGLVIPEQKALKLVDDRIAFALRVEQSKAEAERFFRAREEGGKLHLTTENAFWISLCEAYRWQFFEHQYRCSRLTEYIIHLHTVYASHNHPGAPHPPLPPMPEEIKHYVEFERRNVAGR